MENGGIKAGDVLSMPLQEQGNYLEVFKDCADIVVGVLKLITVNPSGYFKNAWITPAEIVEVWNRKNARQINEEELRLIFSANGDNWFYTQKDASGIVTGVQSTWVTKL